MLISGRVSPVKIILGTDVKVWDLARSQSLKRLETLVDFVQIPVFMRFDYVLVIASLFSLLKHFIS